MLVSLNVRSRVSSSTRDHLIATQQGVRNFVDDVVFMFASVPASGLCRVDDANRRQSALAFVYALIQDNRPALSLTDLKLRDEHLFCCLAGFNSIWNFHAKA